MKRTRRKTASTGPAPLARPVIVTLCGSTRHWDALVEANAREPRAVATALQKLYDI